MAAAAASAAPFASAPASPSSIASCSGSGSSSSSSNRGSSLKPRASASAFSFPRRSIYLFAAGATVAAVAAVASRRATSFFPSPAPSIFAAGPAPAGAKLPSSRIATRTSASMASISIGTPAARTITIQPTKEHKATVVFLHGLGDTGEGWADIPTMMQLPNVKWVLPSAPIKPVSLNGGFPMPAWFDIFGLSADAKEDKAGIDKAAQFIAQVLVDEKSKAPAGAKILVGGFSMGGALALYLTARKHLGTFVDGGDASGVPLDGTVSLSAWLPLASTILGKPVKSPETTAAYPVMLCHGQADPLVQYAFGKLSADELRTLGFSSLKLKSYPNLAHSACPEELQEVQKFIQAVTAS